MSDLPTCWRYRQFISSRFTYFLELLELSQIIFHWEPEDLCHCVATYSILYFQCNIIFSGYAIGMYRILSCRSTCIAKVPRPRSGWSGTLVYEVYCRWCCWGGDYKKTGWSGSLVYEIYCRWCYWGRDYMKIGDWDFYVCYDMRYFAFMIGYRYCKCSCWQ